MADGFIPIPRCVEGGDSLVSASYANKIIIPLNAILNGRVAPIANVGTFKFAGGQFILDLSALDGRLRAVERRLNGASITANGSCSGNNISINISLNI